MIEVCSTKSICLIGKAKDVLDQIKIMANQYTTVKEVIEDHQDNLQLLFQQHQEI